MPISARNRSKNASCTSASFPYGKSGVETVFATGAYRISAFVRSGWVAANSIAMDAARAPPNTIASSEPAASITAPTSSRWSSSTGGSGPRSDSPTPRMSKRISRENLARRFRKCAQSGCSHMISTLDQMPVAYTRSTGPSPTTW